MIYGLGSDLVNVKRIEKMMQRFPGFPERWFTSAEQNLAKTRKHRPEFFAGRFAAKEAVAKALGTGMGKHAHWREISVGAEATGRPLVTLSGVTHHTAQQLVGGAGYKIHVSLSHEKDQALAFVIIESVAI